MRVLLVNTTEKGGGAAIATNRLKEALINNGIKAKMLVRKKESQSLSVVGIDSWKQNYSFLKERFNIWTANGFSREHLFDVDLGCNGSDITELREFQEADIIHLNWINQGLLSLRDIKKILNSGKPVVWTMHDMWQFTGICHYTGDCTEYKTGCRNCPMLTKPGNKDLSCKIFNRKARLLKDKKIHFVAVSQWLADKAKESKLLQFQPVSVIPNALSVNHFQLKDRENSRRQFSLPEKIIIVFGAVKMDETRKGLKYLIEALNYMVANGMFKREDLHLALFGGVKNPEILQEIPVSYTDVGFIKDDEALSALYAAANVTVIPSLYETFGQTVIEAQACGCTPVTFNNSGQTDIVQHLVNGYLAEYLNVEDLAKGIQWAIQSKLNPNDLRSNVIKNFSESVVANKYIELYNSLARTEA